MGKVGVQWSERRSLLKTELQPTTHIVEKVQRARSSDDSLVLSCVGKAREVSLAVADVVFKGVERLDAAKVSNVPDLDHTVLAGRDDLGRVFDKLDAHERGGVSLQSADEVLRGGRGVCSGVG